jgi:hypothetical protein
MKLKAPFPWFGLLPENVAKKIGDPVVAGYRTPCWPWMAAKTNGYGVVQYQGRLQRAHRVIRTILVGPIPDGLEPDHLCRNRWCVNPEHTEPVTQSENNLRSESQSAKHARQTHCVRGHEFTPENTYTRTRGHKTERFCRECCRIRDNERYRRNSAREVELCQH